MQRHHRRRQTPASRQNRQKPFVSRIWSKDVTSKRTQEKTHGYRRPISRVLSVHRGAPDGHSSRRAVTDTLQQPTRGSLRQPEDLAALSRRAVSHRLFGLAPVGVYRATFVAERAVGSYPTLSPLPPSCEDGGLLSVALSVARSSRRTHPGVTWQPALWSPDFPRSQGAATRARPPTSRPSGRRHPCVPNITAHVSMTGNGQPNTRLDKPLYARR